MDFIAAGWMSLVSFILLFGFAVLYLYRKDHDTHKLMFALGMLPSALTFSIYTLEALGFFMPNILSDRLTLWGSIPLIICIFFILFNQIFFKKKEPTFIFKGFLFFFIISFILIASGIFTYTIFQISTQMAAILIITFSFVLLIRDRNLSGIFFIFAMICFALGGITLTEFVEHPSNGTLFNPLLCYFMSYIFLVLIVITSFTQEKAKGVGAYFSLKNKIQTVEKALQESQKNYQLIVENSRDAIMLTKPDGIISYLSPSCESVLGYKPEELIGQRPNIVHPDDSDFVQKFFSQALQGGSSPNLQYRIQTKKGETKWISHVFTPFKKDNRLELIVSTLRDITEIKLVEKELFEKVVTLEESERATLNIMDDFQDAIGSLLQAQEEIRKKNKDLQTNTEQLAMFNQELNVAREQLYLLNKDLEQKVQDRTSEIEKLLKQKDEFIGQLGHDLKTPLTPLNTLLPIIINREQDPKLVELLEVTIKNVSYIKNLVKKTLQLAQLNSPNDILVTIDFTLSAEIKKALENMHSTLEETGIIVESNLDDSIIVKADRLQITEVIDNLLSNAMKYTPPGGKITISTVQEQDSVITTIQDTGIGLSLEQLEHLFEEFYKADRARHDLQSTGLGLSICKRIVEKHGGKIWAESPGLGKGSTFHFTMKISDNKLNKPQQDFLLHNEM